ncbi:DUF6226 family protein [Ruania rhizosphaerae]|uniref:DUF6226 family protein n=1 Tax=Ruania rhizosphaerae TaxID=1840413 RepID=UPI00135BBB82|nr:DUF6226 family protein [Ruania rhizosphaerae]
MSTYRRPPIDAPVFRDTDGRVIDYGNRWFDHPPEETYSVVTHPDRFAPLHAIGDALIAHLQENYDVETDEGEETALDLLTSARAEVVRAVRIRPNDPACASLTFVFTAFPGIFLHAGLLHDFHLPVCGCDACDSTWSEEADTVERLVLAVVNGHYREGIGEGSQPWVDFGLTYPDGASSGSSNSDDLPIERLRAAQPLLRTVSDGWAAWPRRTSA